MSCNSGPGATHHNACDCREAYFAKILAVAKAAADHLTASGPCENAEEDADVSHCDDDQCTYCKLNAAASVRYMDGGLL